MAYRRRQQQASSTVKVLSEVHNDNNEEEEEEEEERNKIINLVKPQRPPSATLTDDDVDASNSYVTTSLSSSSSLVAKAVRASHANKDASLSSSGVYSRPFPSSKDARPYEYATVKSSDESKHGFWGVLARKARAILDDDDGDSGGDGVTQRSETVSNARPSAVSRAVSEDKYHQYAPHDGRQRTERPALKKGFNAITSSINYIGNAVEGGLNIVENRTAGLIKETRKHIQRKPGTFETNQATDRSGTWHQPQKTPQTQTDLELQLKASRDVAMAMAAKAKLLLRELKTVKADLAFAKERCAQLEDENKILRENRARGDHPEDDEMIRLQLETLLAEKARLAHENSVYTRENRFLREIVEYHQLTMQDVVYLDEKTEEVSEVYPIKGPSGSNIQSHPAPSHQHLPS